MFIIKRAMVFFITVFSLLFSSCNIIGLEPLKTSEEMISVDFHFDGDKGRYCLSYVNSQIIFENGVFKIPQEDKEGNAIAGIGSEAIKNIESIEEIIIGDHIEWISYYGIADMPNLKRVYIGKSVTQIYDGLFHNCPQLKELIVHPDNPNFSSVGNCLLSKDGQTLIRIWNESFEIPSSVTIIGESAFERAVFLTTFDIPEGIVEIKGSAFLLCENLKEVIFSPSLKNVETYAFSFCAYELKCYVPEVVDITKFQDGWNFIYGDIFAQVVLMK